MKAYLEITNICNRQCTFCPGTSREKQFVPPDVAACRLAQLKGIADELYLHLLGEPLLHPQFAEIAELCRECGIPVNLTTNGTLLDERKAEILLGNPVFRQINFSLQALNAEELPILKKILEFCRNALRERPELYLNLRFWDLPEDFELQEKQKLFLNTVFEELALPAPETLKFHQNWRSLNLAGRLYIHSGAVFEWLVNAGGKGEGKAFCYGLRNQFGILADGTVVPCCLDSEGSIPLGNVTQEPLRNILDSVRAVSIREGFRRGRAVEELCRRCTYRERLKK